MSLNGLDAPKVKEAHDAAVAEPGGWFLLKYASRDEIDLLDRGNGGIVELRNAIAKYDENSPLFGFLLYRRRKVIIKYLPEDCSRLVQARATVHFNSVCERFAPYDTTFSIDSAKDLRDTKLSAACSLHTASGSTSSSTSSLRRRRLMEITEEEEEEQREKKRQSVVQEERPTTSSSNKSKAAAPSTEPPVTLDPSHLTAPKDAEFASTTEVPTFEGAPRPASPAKSEDYRRNSTQITRPELHSYATYSTYGKPKVKLGPRPSLDASKRPQTAGNFRPIAALPAGFKMFSKGSKKGRTRDEELAEEPENATNEAIFDPTVVPIPEIPQDDEIQRIRPSTSSGASIKSFKSTLTLTAPSPSAKEAKITPEKARLMKAMKLREQKKHMSLQSPEPSPIVDATPTIQATIPEQPEPPVEGSLDATHGQNQLSISNTMEPAVAADLPTPMTINTAHSVDTLTDSHPASPTGASSDIDDSTKASSLSESTDETVAAHIGPLEKPNLDGSKLNSGPDGEANGSAYGVQEEIESSPVSSETKETISLDDSLESSSELATGTENTPIPVTATEEVAQTTESLEVPLQASDVSISPQIEPKPPLIIPTSRFSTKEIESVGTAQSPGSRSLKSKFSTQDFRLPSDPSLETIINPSVDGSPVEHVAKSTGTEDIETTNADDGALLVESVEQEEDRADAPLEVSIDDQMQLPRRRANIEPIRTDLNSVERDGNLSDDDALMEELQSATLQEARPITVSKSPITPAFPVFQANSPPKRSRNEALSPITRTVSNPLRASFLVPGDVSQSSARSFSAGGAAYLHNITRQASTSGISAKSGKIGSSISQRIKALEKLSGTTEGEQPRPRTAAPSSTFFNVRKSSIKDPSRSPSIADRANSLSGGHHQTPDRSRESSPETLNAGIGKRERSGSVASRLSMFEMPGSNAPRGRPESVQVTARIVREPGHTFPSKPEAHKDPADYGPIDLKQSPLVIDHQKAAPASPTPEPPTVLPVIETPRETIQERRLSRESKRKQSISEDSLKARRSSLTIVRDFIKDRRNSLAGKSPSTDNLPVTSPTPSSMKSPSRPPSTHQTSGFGSRLSVSSRRSSLSKDRDNGTPTQVMSPASFTDLSGSGDEGTKSDSKKKNRASRFMRRLSNSLSSSRKGNAPNISPTVDEEDGEELAPPSTAVTTDSRVSMNTSSSITNYLGDVNVQFPDNLLWKRRSMSLDIQGFLILSAVQGVGKEKTAGAGVKRYHLSDFKMPYIPDLEVQELPNSVVLEFVDASGIQIACEDRAGQMNVLHTLQDAHRAHTSFGQ